MPEQHRTAGPDADIRRVIVGCDDSRRRALMRLGLEMSGTFKVVGVAVEPRDLAGVLRRHGADVVILAFTQRCAAPVVDAVHDAAPRALVVDVPVDAPLRPAPFARELADQLASMNGRVAHDVPASSHL